MTIMTVYVRAKSKKALNEALSQNDPVWDVVVAIEYTPWQERHRNLYDLPDGSVIKIYDKFVGGLPYAKAYGTWDAKKKRVR